MQELKDETKKLRHENDLMDLKRVVRDSIRAETLREGVSLKIENEDGRVYIPLAPSPTNQNITNTYMLF